jgi:hypothetical protein
MKHFEQTLATCLLTHLQNMQYLGLLLQHPYKIPATYLWNIWNTWNIYLQHMGREVGAGWFRPQGTSTTSTGRAHGCPWLGQGPTWGTRRHHEHQQRRRGAPNSVGASGAGVRASGWDCRSKEQEVRVGARDGQEWEVNNTRWRRVWRSEKWTTQGGGACGEIAAVENAEWGERTATPHKVVDIFERET